jgi:hypothetical protein
VFAESRDHILCDTLKLNLPLILDFAPILTPWFGLCYFIFGLSLDWILGRFQRYFWKVLKTVATKLDSRQLRLQGTSQL